MPSIKQLHTLWESQFEFFYRDQDYILRPKPTKNMYQKNFDHHGQLTVEALCKEFNTQLPVVDNIVCPYTVGIEIECKFRYYFPELFNRYFKDNTYMQLNSLDQQAIDGLISHHEKILLLKLEAVVECGIPRGGDKYWEFAMNPVNNIKYLVQQILILKKLELIPSGRHSLHITLGGLKPSRELYWILAYLQLIFIDKQRIQEALEKVEEQKSQSWGKKGLAGIHPKFESDLEESTQGLEFRTLYIDDNTNIIQLFTTLNKLLTLLYNGHPLPFIDLVNEFKTCGLPDVNWGRPHQSKEIWDMYIVNYEHLSIFAKSINI